MAGHLSILGIVFIFSGLLLLWLSLLNLRRREVGPVHRDAIKNVELFWEQYPFHLYPLLCKALELAFLQREIAKVISSESKIAELAIGDGSLSQHIYPPECRIVGVDISPFSLRSSARMRHLREAVVADCLNPPLSSGAFDLLVTNNFLHHVTNKEVALDHIARIARRSIFNENSTYWASSWPKPFLLKRLGFRRAADRAANQLARTFLQDLRSLTDIRKIVEERFAVTAEVRYLASTTYFICGLYSRLMGVYGPPTPGYMKRFAKAPRLRSAIETTCRSVATALLRFDARQDQATAAFVSYSCESRTWKAATQSSHLKCARCDGQLTAQSVCQTCGNECPVVDNMVFNLPLEFDFIREHYLTHVWDVYERESLSQHQ